MKEETLVKIADRVNKEARETLLSRYTDTSMQKALNAVRRQNLITNGFSKDRNFRWIGNIPEDIYLAFCRIYGEKNLKKDRGLFKKVFAPWLLVKPESI